MYYEEKCVNGQWFWRGTPNGDWEPLDKDKEIPAALVEAGDRLTARERIERESATETATIRRITASTGYQKQAANARPALKRMLERLEKLEAENAKLREENIALGGASTMMACVGCNRGVRPRYAVKGMCAECARDRVAELEGLLGEVDQRGVTHDAAICQVAHRAFCVCGATETEDRINAALRGGEGK